MRRGATWNIGQGTRWPGAKGIPRRSLDILFLAIMGVLLVATLPTWSHSTSWGYYPSLGIGLILAVWGLLSIPVNGVRY
jgi:hypothetical protein